jgi:DNA repair photolyase
MSIIYEPKGRAGEYAPLAANIYKSCSHGCLYCYANKMMKLDKAYFHAENRIRKDAIKNLEKDAAKLRGDDREILFCFLGDPYNPDEPANGITRQAIEIMIRNDLRFTILTKGGARARRDLDLLEGYFKCSIGQTIVWSKQESASYWEPNAAPLQERFELAQEAHKRGIKTWVSLEPVIDPDQALEVVRLLHPYVGKWKVGPVNYVAGVDVDWRKFKQDVVSLFEEVGAEYILKNELLKKAA